MKSKRVLLLKKDETLDILIFRNFVTTILSWQLGDYYVLTLIGMRQGTFTPFVILGLVIVS